MSVDGDSTGDYGYDMLHEVRGIHHLLVGRGRAVAATPAVRGGDLDPESDLGYDQAHEM